jgi:riboflavin synthase
LDEKKIGDAVNIETDVIGKYVERFLMRPGATGHAEKPAGGVDMALLAKSGFI